MRRVLRSFPRNMIYEADKISVASPHLIGQYCRTETRVASKLHRTERHSYEDALTALNSLQTNTVTIQKAISRIHDKTCLNIEETENYLKKIGITLDNLDQLSVIHIAGTKGKGSTCAMVESILRNLNVKTGFYSSPHLLNVTERIRLNGDPIPKHQFAQYFWKIYNTLEKSKQHADDMPSYFKFLTIMAYYVFLKENVDVAVIEVGIGGEYDCTNVLRNTGTVGITSLGLEHTQLLGNTFSDIAWQKSGIIKTGSSVFSSHQNDECIPVLLKRAQAKHANLMFVPNFSEYKYNDEKALAEIAINPTKLRNASLAIQLSYDWIRRNSHKLKQEIIDECLSGGNADDLVLPSKVVEALIKCQWLGRCQTVPWKNMMLYIDGAHTTESLQLCLNWFAAMTKSSCDKKFLLFNITGDRNALNMLNLINSNIQFEQALFTPNLSSLSTQAKDNFYAFGQPNRSQQNADYWASINPQNDSKVFSCIADAFKYLSDTYGQEKITVLVAGSLHLVGEVLRTIKSTEW